MLAERVILPGLGLLEQEPALTPVWDRERCCITCYGLLAVLCATCAHEPSVRLQGSDAAAEAGEWGESGGSRPPIVRVFQLRGSCPNWEPALALARQRACCGVNPDRPNRGDRDRSWRPR